MADFGALPTYEYAATMELDLARTYAASLHLARTETQLVARIAMALECCAAARQAAVIGALPALVAQADELAAAVRAAITHTESAPVALAA